ncbi:actin-binding LIM protein 1-like isoform X7 [Eleginops maclovinus]|uniref:actin-binding LIM protein 1-like isoform X7 n=1 Tax=Eleginops maclovinus TaxID=56733 RepID=UPI0030803DE8
MVSHLVSLCSLICSDDSLDDRSMSGILNLRSLGRICGSSNEMVVLDRVKRKNSVRRMSIIEDGEIAEVLYLIPRQSMMEQLPFINPDDYILCEKLFSTSENMTGPFAQDDPGALGGKRIIPCFRCGESCKGQVLRVQNNHFHIKCFTCKVCGCDLAQSGFFMKNSDYFCPLDFQRIHGTLCNNCGEFVEGQVVTVLGKTYHPACFVCTGCKQPFPAGDCVTFSGKDCLCQRCIRPVSPVLSPKDISSFNNCSGCGRDIKNGQALLALAGQWHLGCFKCKTCRKVLSGEYISKDGVPYCERDYQFQFGVQCDACQRFITGKVLEAGEKHYHPSCARCSRCEKMFKEGEEMFLQGSTVWHPHCRSNSRTDDSYMVSRPKTPCLDFFFPQQKVKPTRSSSESSSSRPGSCTPGSPGRTICASRVDKGNRQDRRSCAESPESVSETTEESFEIKKSIPASASQGSFGVQSLHNRHSYTPSLSRSPQHFHRPGLVLSSSLISCNNDTCPAPPLCHNLLPHTKADEGFNMYRRPPIYKQQDPNSSTSQTASLPGYGRKGLNPPRSADYSHYSSDRFKDFKVCDKTLNPLLLLSLLSCLV